MKILTKNKIIEAFHFPFTEALVFSILLWTSWGLAEAFYWDRLSGWMHGEQQSYPYIYLQAFFIYVAVAAFLATLIYIGMRILLAIFHLHNTRTFRAFTLCGILGIFFLAALYHSFTSAVWQSLSNPLRYVLIGVLIAFALGLLVLLNHWSSGDDFRIRRSGTMMLSILIISCVLSFVPFPIFSKESSTTELKQSPGYHRLMAYQYLAPLLNP